MYASVIAAPLIVGTAIGLSVPELGVLVSSSLLVAGLSTMLQSLGIWRFGARLPLVLGPSFVPVTAMTIIGKDQGLPTVFGACIGAGIVGLLIVPTFSTLVRFFPPVVTGSVIVTIGLSLIPVAGGWAMGSTPSAPDYGSLPNLALAAGTLVLAVVLTRFLPESLNRMAILFSLVIATVVAALLGLADFTGVGDGPVVGITMPLHFGPPVFDVGAIITLSLLTLITLTEGTAHILTIGEIVGSPTPPRRVADGLRADIVTSVFAPLINSFPCVSFAGNMGLVALSRVRSRFVVAVTGASLLVLGCVPFLGRVVAAIPMPVLGGIGLMLFGTIVAMGVRTLAKVELDGGHNVVIIAASVGIGILPVAIPGIYHAMPAWLDPFLESGILAAAATAFVLNILFNVVGRGTVRVPVPEGGARDVPDAA
jgi:NCS2 family nucleobase:cation symporter-2